MYMAIGIGSDEPTRWCASFSRYVWLRPNSSIRSIIHRGTGGHVLIMIMIIIAIIISMYNIYIYIYTHIYIHIYIYILIIIMIITCGRRRRPGASSPETSAAPGGRTSSRS